MLKLKGNIMRILLSKWIHNRHNLPYIYIIYTKLLVNLYLLDLKKEKQLIVSLLYIVLVFKFFFY